MHPTEPLPPRRPRCRPALVPALLLALAALAPAPARAEGDGAAGAPGPLTQQIELPLGTGVRLTVREAAGTVEAVVGSDPAFLVRVGEGSAAAAPAGDDLTARLRERLRLARRPLVTVEALAPGLALLQAPAGAHFALREDLRAEDVTLRVVAAVGPWSGGRRRVDAGRALSLQATAAGSEAAAAAAGAPPADADARLRAWHALAEPRGRLDALLGTAQAGESEEQRWARVMAPLLVLPRDVADEAGRAEAVSLLGALAPALPAVAALLADAATAGPSLPGSAARAALDTPEAQGPVVFDALVEQGARDPLARADRAIGLLKPRAAAEAERVLALLRAPTPERRTLGLNLLARLAAVPLERVRALELPALLTDPAPAAQALGLLSRLRLAASAPLAAPEAYHLAALLEDVMLRAAFETALRESRPGAATAASLAPTLEAVLGADAPPAARALAALALPALASADPAALQPLAADALVRCLQAVALTRASAPSRLPPEAWLAALEAADAEVRASAAAALALQRGLPGPVRERLRALSLDAAQPLTVRWLASAALALQGGAPAAMLKDLRAGLQNPELSPWAPFVRTLLRNAD